MREVEVRAGRYIEELKILLTSVEMTACLAPGATFMKAAVGS